MSKPPLEPTNRWFFTTKKKFFQSKTRKITTKFSAQYNHANKNIEKTTNQLSASQQYSLT